MSIPERPQKGNLAAMREAIRRRQQEQARAEEATPAAPQPAAPAPPEPKKTKKPAGPPCEKCARRAAHDERTRAAKREAQERRRLKNLERESRPPPDRGPRQLLDAAGRLPHGSAFAVVYDATTKRWSGALTVPREGADPLVIDGNDSGVERLLRFLARGVHEEPQS